MAAEPLPARRHAGETEDQRLDRNWNELLQELRVAQTGVQILLGFLLTVPFGPRFDDVTDAQRTVYLVVLCGSVLATSLLVAPAAFHRVLFRRGLRPWLVDRAHRTATAGLAVLALTLTGVVWLMFDVVLGHTPAHVAAAATLVLFTSLWVLWPGLLYRHGEAAD
ncbi:sodium:proton antiporter [Auraticoccus sp. F435]|uniref:Sodium:proton antiporter n=1 Tax=Auraticoccus cholistanensis TaxID=2656650 RepID=A0A6A9V1R4_9ACTN|nr:DUF6328 family protein [Auraticoccus cholistanensis]MVA77514.1 sodium:proton antiporter [Auraticoccus cholistanensis]